MRIFLTVNLALAPFIVLWALLAARHPALAIAAGLALSLLGNAWRPGTATSWCWKSAASFCPAC
jgi:hypothetical protein